MSMVTPGQHRTWIFRSSLRAAAAGLALAIMFVLTIGAAGAVQAQTYQVIHNFVGGVDGAEPTFGLTIDAAGTLYGTTFEGDAGTGTAYKLAYKSTGWALTPLYVFTVNNNGVIPYSTLVIGRDGKLYGYHRIWGSKWTVRGLRAHRLRHRLHFADSNHLLSHHILSLDRNAALQIQRI